VMLRREQIVSYYPPLGYGYQKNKQELTHFSLLSA
jgi:hypothetical protein